MFFLSLPYYYVTFFDLLRKGKKNGNNWNVKMLISSWNFFVMFHIGAGIKGTYTDSTAKTHSH
jgi:hypothetical protein